MKDEIKMREGNYGRAKPSLRYLQKRLEDIAIIINKGYFSVDCQNDLPEDFPNSK